MFGRRVRRPVWLEQVSKADSNSGGGSEGNERELSCMQSCRPR